MSVFSIQPSSKTYLSLSMARVATQEKENLKCRGSRDSRIAGKQIKRDTIDILFLQSSQLSFKGKETENWKKNIQPASHFRYCIFMCLLLVAS